MGWKGWANLGLNVHQSAELTDLKQQLREQSQVLQQRSRKEADQRTNQEEEVSNLKKTLTEESAKLERLTLQQKKARQLAPKPRPKLSKRAKASRNLKARETRRQQTIGRAASAKEEEQKRQNAILNARQAMFECRQALEAIVVERPPLALHLELMAVKRSIDAVRMKYLADYADKEYHSQTAQLWLATYSRLLPTWDKNMQTAANEVGRLVDRACKRITTVLVVLHKGVRPLLTQHSIWKDISQIEETVFAIQRTLKAIPGAEPTDIPRWPAVKSAIAHLILPQKHNLFLFKCAILIAKADGAVDAAEAAFINELGAKVFLTPDEIARMLKADASISHEDFRGDAHEARLIFARLCQCAAADGQLTEPERLALFRAAEILGIGSSEASAIHDRVVRHVGEHGPSA